MDVESTSLPSMYSAPPFDVAEQEANSTEEKESFLPDDRVAEIAPPFSDEHDVNVAPEIV